MKYIIIFCVLFYSASCQDFRKIDTNKRFENIIDYIKSDSMIKKILYIYYPEIDCFDFPDTTIYANLSVEGYQFIFNDTNTSHRYKWYLQKYLDTINIRKKNEWFTEKTNYKKSNCKSIYDFEIIFVHDHWIIFIIPKETLPGLWRYIVYNFKFNEQDNIIKVRTSFAMQ